MCERESVSIGTINTAMCVGVCVSLWCVPVWVFECDERIHSLQFVSAVYMFLYISCLHVTS